MAVHEYRNPKEMVLFDDRSLYIFDGDDHKPRAFHLDEDDVVITITTKPKPPAPILPGEKYIIDLFGDYTTTVTVIGTFGDEVWVHDEDGDTEIYGAEFLREQTKV